MADLTAKVTFNIFKFNFTHFQGKYLSSSEILRKCIERINYERITNREVVVLDRYKSRSNELPRNIFIYKAAFDHRSRKFKCTFALIRSGKTPDLISKDNYKAVDNDKIKDSFLLAEMTNLVVDISKKTPVVVIEYNTNGPKISDVEFYFRHVSHKILRISKACNTEIMFKMPIDKVLGSLKNVLKFDIKANPKRLSYLTNEIDYNFMGNMQALSSSLEPKAIRVEGFFREKGVNESKINTKANSLVKKILLAVKKDHKISDDIDDFSFEFLDNQGREDVFNLLKGKEEIIIDCKFKSKGKYDRDDLFDKICFKFDEYLEKRNEKYVEG